MIKSVKCTLDNWCNIEEWLEKWVIDKQEIQERSEADKT